jgi:restriction endonuclease S subunit
VPLRGLIRLNTDTVSPSDFPDTRFRVLGVNNETGVFLNGTLPGAEIKQRYYRVKPGEFCYNPYRINVGSIGLNEFDYDNQITSGAYVVFGTSEGELHPKFLGALFKTPQFLAYVNEKASGGVRMNFKFEHLEDWEIPLMERQKELVAELERLNSFADATFAVAKNWETRIPTTEDSREIGDFVSESLYGIADKLADSGLYPVLRMNNLDERGFWHLDDLKFIDDEPSEERRIQHGDLIFNRTNSIDLVGKAAVVDFDFSGTWAGYLVRLRFNNELNPLYLRDVLSTRRFRQILSAAAKPAGGQANLNVEEFSKISIPYFSPQRQAAIVAANEKERLAIQQIVKMGDDARLSANQLLQSLWEK